MKKLIYLCCALMMGSVFFSSCGSDDPDTNNNQGGNNTENTDPEPEDPTEPTEPEEVNDSLVLITYSGSTATVNIPEAMEGVTCTSGTSSHVVLESTNTTKEMYYAISGSSTAGSLTINGSYKLSVMLNGVSLTSDKGAAINIQCGKRINLIMAENSTNSLADYAAGEQKACLYTKGHLEIEGAGTLNVKGNSNHAIQKLNHYMPARFILRLSLTKLLEESIITVLLTVNRIYKFL